MDLMCTRRIYPISTRALGLVEGFVRALDQFLCGMRLSRPRSNAEARRHGNGAKIAAYLLGLDQAPYTLSEGNRPNAVGLIKN